MRTPWRTKRIKEGDDNEHKVLNVRTRQRHEQKRERYGATCSGDKWRLHKV